MRMAMEEMKLFRRERLKELYNAEAQMYTNELRAKGFAIVS